MAHFAQVIHGLVSQVIVIANEDCGGGNYPESQPVGQAFIASLGIAGTWLQTSYHANFCGAYAGIGYTYDLATNTFTPPPTPQPDNE